MKKSLVYSTNFKINDKRKYICGEVSQTILNRDLFKNNEDLKVYIKIIEEFPGITEYKDYLYKSRTMLIARIVKDINITFDDKQLLEFIDKHFSFLGKNEDDNFSKDEKNEKSAKINNNTILKNYIDAKKKRKL